MPQSLANILVHLVFSTKERDPLIRPEIEGELHPYLSALLKDCDCVPIIIGGTNDHIHILCKVSKTRSVSAVVEDVKKKSSKWIKSKGEKYADFYWQGGYGAFSIGKSQVPDLVKYIQGQKEHHKEVSFQEEFLLFLKRCDVEFDERYLWD